MSEERQRFYQQLDELYAQGRQSEIEAFLQEQLNASAVCCGKYSPMQVTVYNELGSFYRGQGRLEASEENFSTAASLIYAHLGENVIEYATTMNNLGGTQRLAGHSDEARRSFGDALRVYENTVGKNSYLYTSSLNNLALLEISTGGYDRAHELLQDALAAIEGLENCRQEKAITLCNLGTCSLYKKDYAAAERYLNQSAQLYSELPDDQQMHLAAVYNSLGQVYQQVERLDEGLEAFRKAQELTQRYSGRNTEYAATCESMARVLHQMGKPDQAALQLKQGIAALEGLGCTSSAQYTNMHAQLQKLTESLA